MPDYFISYEDAEKNLLACSAYLAERIKSSDGHAEAMKTIIPRYLGKQNVDLAAELANAVDDPFSRDQLLTMVAEKCAELGDDEYALQLVDAVEDQGMRAQAHERVAVVMAHRGDTAKAAEIAETMAHPDFVYASIAVQQAGSGDESTANMTLDKIDFPTARVSALLHMASVAINDKEPEKAADLLQRAVDAAGEIEHDEEKIRTLCDIGNLFIEAGRNDAAINTFETARGLAEVLDNIHRDFFLVNCALGFLFAGSRDTAERTLDLVMDKTQMGSALLGFARDEWSKDKKEDALDTIEEAFAIVNSQREAETRDRRSRNTLLSAISAQFAGFGRTDRAVEIAMLNPDPNEEMTALSQIAQILIIQKDDQQARETIDMIKEDATRLFGLLGLSDAKTKLGEAEAAATLLDDAASLADTVPQLAARSSVLNQIALRWVDHGQMEKARQVTHENLELITHIRDESSRAVELANLSSVRERSNLDLTEDEKAVLEKLTRCI
jgi:tetratricopeptide (TPR) repeat protein